MRNLLSSKILGFALSLTAVWLLASSAFGAAINVNLVAEKATVTMPDTTVVQMWGFRDVADLSHTAGLWKIPTISAMAGDSLTITLDNLLEAPGLVENVSVIIPGQKATEVGALAPEFFLDDQGRRRVNSFTHSVAPLGSGVYDWNSLRAGTYLIQSGTHPQIQMQMGLYAILKVDAGPNMAYPGIAYDNELTLLFSEIDTVLHAAIANGTYGTPPAPTSTMGYKPSYFLINGQPHTAATAPIPVNSGESLLLRLLNAGYKNRVPLVQGSYMNLVAEDGYVKPFAQEKYSLVLPPAKTLDAMIPVAPAGMLALYDRTLNLGTADGANNGMLAVLDVSMQATLVKVPAAGGSFDFVATVGGGAAPYTYNFWYHDPAIGWSLAQSSAADTWNWTPPVAPGLYRVAAVVTDSTGLSATSNYASHQINAPDISAVALAKTVLGNGTIDFTATPTDGVAPYEYEFWLHDPAAGWSQVQAYSTADTFNWTPSTTPNLYRVAVIARGAGSAVTVSDIISHEVVALPANSVVLTESPGTPGTFDFTAAAAGGSAPYEYEFWFYDPASGWSQVQAFSLADTYNLTSPTVPGTYRVGVIARAQGTTTTVVDIIDHVVTVPALPATSVTLAETSGAAPGTFNFTGTAAGGTAPYEYEFWFYDPASGWSQVQAFSTLNTYIWTPPATPGAYRIAVIARAQGTTATVSDILSHPIP